ncbi:glutamate 5-kinase [Oceanospirillum sediminis]|uniref:Glutamate 5-kinase n=1 Tax=Oceanospirillum sediminis TaxID=2760088 RepID=A0A839IV07_9GAMM|nr:glutamate 5-kinase [Oceanospirillum sediminis]MBB1487956.1 glutamate 5-kinase [Oceanospirillum sediminis]
MSQRDRLVRAKRIVVKIGSALLTNDGAGLDLPSIAGWVDQMAALHQQGIELILVSSGSVAEGMSRLGLRERPSTLHELQAAAAVGQMGLVQAYESQFMRHGIQAAQILLTHDDLSDRKRYLNARSTVKSLLELNVIPIINENDTVVTDEIRFGDNDTLGALVANLMEADTLMILTDQEGLFTADPRSVPDATLISEAWADDPELAGMAGDGGRLGRGGMITKVRAASLAARSGATTLVASGRQPDILVRAVKGEALGTLFLPKDTPWAARKRWLAGHLQTRGTLMLDDGAVRVLTEKNTSLLSVGVKQATGRFRRGDMVQCVSEQGVLIAKGLVNYDHDDVQKILGQPSHKIEALLGYIADPELINRDNLVLV